MAVFERLQEDIKEAMKARDQEKLLALRTLSSDIKKITIDAGRREPTDEDALAAVAKAIKQREDAACQFQAVGRQDLLDREVAQVGWIKAYQPAQMSAEEIELLAKAIISELGATSRKDSGKVLGQLMPKVKGKADGKLVQSTVQALLPA